ncbi:unnamed protein product [Ixodes persulcatus]
MLTLFILSIRVHEVYFKVLGDWEAFRCRICSRCLVFSLAFCFNLNLNSLWVLRFAKHTVDADVCGARRFDSPNDDTALVLPKSNRRAPRTFGFNIVFDECRVQVSWLDVAANFRCVCYAGFHPTVSLATRIILLK